MIHLMDRLSELDNKDPLYRLGDLPGKAYIARRHFIHNLPLLNRMHGNLTLHDQHHSENVTRLASDLCSLTHLFDDANPQALTKYELYYLMAACWLHDIGLAVSREEDSREMERRNLSKAWTIIRETHHLRSAEYIREHKDSLLLSEDEADILAQTCQGHSASEDLSTPPYEDRFGPGVSPIRLSVICAILRIADAMDLTSMRAPEPVRSMWDRTGWDDPKAKIHWLKHWYTSGATFKLEKDSVRTRLFPEIMLTVPDELHGKTMRDIIGEDLRKESEGIREPLSRIGVAIGEPSFRTTINTQKTRFIFSKQDIGILIVEDDDDYARHVAEDVKLYGYTVAGIKNTPDAALLDVQSKPHAYRLLFMDIWLPHPETKIASSDVGIRYINIIHNAYPDILIIAYSSLMDNILSQQCSNAGAVYTHNKTGTGEGKIADMILKEHLYIVD